jgi:hypothetical protein
MLSTSSGIPVSPTFFFPLPTPIYCNTCRHPRQNSFSASFFILLFVDSNITRVRWHSGVSDVFSFLCPPCILQHLPPSLTKIHSLLSFFTLLFVESDVVRVQRHSGASDVFFPSKFIPHILRDIWRVSTHFLISSFAIPHVSTHPLLL